ncbi:MAG TPA: superoxide dismutase family protein [Anaerovoracaceae bacterium]|nr:superoxide dismutase family protein [Anaerovoracaceae bacterium]
MILASQNQFHFLSDILKKTPDATALIYGGPTYPDIRGIVCFYQLSEGVLLFVQVSGLPYDQGPCGSRMFGFHIHEGSTCTGNSQNPFADTRGHYNPDNCQHPHHAGDLPPLFGNNGLAYQSVFTNRFAVDEVIGRTMIIHINPDDFTTQPSGNSGAEIACGQIV